MRSSSAEGIAGVELDCAVEVVVAGAVVEGAGTDGGDGWFQATRLSSGVKTVWVVEAWAD
jgi:hypothetical protein